MGLGPETLQELQLPPTIKPHVLSCQCSPPSLIPQAQMEFHLLQEALGAYSGP